MVAVGHVVCPVDFSPGSRLALGYAFGLAARYDARLRVVHVVPPAVPITGPGTYGVQFLHRRIDKTAAEVAQFVRQVHNPGVEVDIDVREGQPADVILEVAVRDSHAVIVMATHGRAGVSRMLLGSVAERVAHRTTRPLLVVPPHAIEHAGEEAAAFARILCAVDLRASSLAALRAALALARESDTTIDVVSVLDLPPEDEARRVESEAGLKRRTEACRKRLQALRALVPDDARQECWVYEHVRTGEPAAEILAYAQDASSDLIVVGTGDNRHLGAHWLGRTADRILRQATCPVLIVPVARVARAVQATYLPPERWADELARLTERYRGLPATVSVTADLSGAQTEAKALPLCAMSADRNNEHGSIIVILGACDAARLTHFITRPIEMRVGAMNDGDSQTQLLITAEDGTTTVIDLGVREFVRSPTRRAVGDIP